MNKKQVQEAIGRIDGILNKGRFTEPLLNREDHIILAKDIKLIQDVCEQYFKEEPKDGGTDECPEHVESGDEDSQRSGDSV